MAFIELKGIGTVPGTTSFYWGCATCRNSWVSGDALFYEGARSDGAEMFLLLDVEHHGPEAADVAECLAEQLRDNLSGRSPSQLLKDLHSRMAPVWAAVGQADERFVAAGAVLVVADQSRLSVALAGIQSPIIERDGKCVPTSLPGGHLLGVPVLLDLPLEEWSYAPEELVLSGDGTVWFFSDGASDVGMPGSGTELGTRGLAHEIEMLPPQTPGTTRIVSLLGRLRSIADMEWPQDDTTVLCIQSYPLESVSGGSG